MDWEKWGKPEVVDIYGVLDSVAEVVGDLMISQFKDQKEYRDAIHTIIEAFKENTKPVEV